MEKSVESLFLIAGLHFAKEFGALLGLTLHYSDHFLCVSLPPKTALCRPMKVLQKIHPKIYFWRMAQRMLNKKRLEHVIMHEKRGDDQSMPDFDSLTTFQFK